MTRLTSSVVERPFTKRSRHTNVQLAAATNDSSWPHRALRRRVPLGPERVPSVPQMANAHGASTPVREGLFKLHLSLFAAVLERQSRPGHSRVSVRLLNGFGANIEYRLQACEVRELDRFRSRNVKHAPARWNGPMSQRHDHHAPFAQERSYVRHNPPCRLPYWASINPQILFVTKFAGSSPPWRHDSNA